MFEKKSSDKVICRSTGMLTGNIFNMMKKINQMRLFLSQQYLHKLLCPEEFRNKLLSPENFWHITFIFRRYSCIWVSLGGKFSNLLCPEEFLHKLLCREDLRNKFLCFQKI